MSDEQNIQVEEEIEDLWQMLGIEDPEAEDSHGGAVEEAEAEAEREDQLERKLTSKMSDMQKKFDQTILREKVSKFQDNADPLEKDLFKAIAADVKDPATFDRAVGIIKRQATAMKEEANKYREQTKEEADAQERQNAARAWGTGPVGTPTPRSKDYEEELLKRIYDGDPAAALEGIVGDDVPWLQPNYRGR